MRYRCLLPLSIAAVVLLPTGASSAPKLIDCTCYDLFVIRPDGSHDALLSRGGGRNLFDVSPDRKRILYSHEIGQLRISTVRARHKRPLANGIQIRNARFSPDSRRVLYEIDTTRCSGGLPELHVIDADGDSDRTIGCSGYLVGWSNDSRRILFARYTTPERAETELVVANRNGSHERTIATARVIYGAAWSPRGNLVAYVTGGYKADVLWVVRPDGSQRLRLARGSTPTWSPDGRGLAFNWRRSGRALKYLATINADGTHAHVVDPKAIDGYGQGIGWSPDGRRIVYRRDADARCRCKMALVVARRNGTHRRRLKLGEKNEEFGPLYWLPKSKAILYTSYVQKGV